MEIIKEIYVTLLEEGTPTIRPTRAVELGHHQYKLLPTDHYNPENEVWEFEPGTIVFGQEVQSENGPVLLAVRFPESKWEILQKHPNHGVIKIHVRDRHKARKSVETEAVDLKNGLFKLLPTEAYNPRYDSWEFTPGSVVRVDRKKNIFGQETVWAFDQIREDMMDGFYARSVLEADARR